MKVEVKDSIVQVSRETFDSEEKTKNKPYLTLTVISYFHREELPRLRSLTLVESLSWITFSSRRAKSKYVVFAGATQVFGLDY